LAAGSDTAELKFVINDICVSFFQSVDEGSSGNKLPLAAASMAMCCRKLAAIE
jgi:hypothetical protein